MERNIQDLLAEHAFFRDMQPQALELMAGCAKNVHFEAGSYIAHEGDDATTFYAVRRGRVAVEIYSPERGPLTVQTLGAGDMLGWSWLFAPHNLALRRRGGRIGQRGGIRRRLPARQGRERSR